MVVVERGPVPGGRAGLLERDGYRFDTGPSVLTMTGILRDVFAAAGASLDDHVRLHPLDPTYRAVFADGSELRVRPGVEAMTEEIRAFAGAADASRFAGFCRWLTELNDVELPHFIDRNFDSPLDLARPVRPALRLARLGGFAKLHRLVARRFSDERLRRVFSFQALYAGLSPFEALGAAPMRRRFLVRSQVCGGVPRQAPRGQARARGPSAGPVSRRSWPLGGRAHRRRTSPSALRLACWPGMSKRRR